MAVVSALWMCTNGVLDVHERFCFGAAPTSGEAALPVTDLAVGDALLLRQTGAGTHLGKAIAAGALDSSSEHLELE